MTTRVLARSWWVSPEGRDRLSWVLVAGLADRDAVSRGAAWLELALLIPWLLKAGHSPQAAEQWVSQFPFWTQARPADIDMFTAAFAQQWRTAGRQRDDSWVRRHAELTGRWATYRLGS